MKIETIIKINNVLTKLRELSKKFNYNITKALVTDFFITNKLINNQNVKLNGLVGKYGELINGEYVINDPEKIAAYNSEVEAIYDEDVDLLTIGFIPISENLFGGSEVDMVTLELVDALISYCK